MKTKKPKHILLVDWQNENDPQKPDMWWRLGAWLLALRYTIVVKCKTVADVYAALQHLDPERGDRVDVHCHARPGGVIIGGKPLDALHDVWKLCAGCVLWIRGCDFMRGVRGIVFAETLARAGVNVAGHLSVIGYGGKHPCLVGLRAGKNATAWWSPALDGNDPKVAKKIDRTVGALDNRIPAWAWAPGRGI